MDTPTLRAIRAKISETSYLRTCQAFGLSRTTMGTFLAGAARPGTVALIEKRAVEMGLIDPAPSEKDVEKIAKLMGTTPAKMKRDGVIR